MVTINFNPFPVLKTNRLLLRQLEPADVNEVFIMRTDDRAMEYIDRAKCKSTEEALAFIEMLNRLENNNESITWGITFQGQKNIVGTICIWHIDVDNYRAEVGYTMLPDYFGKGIMQESLAKVLEYAFQQLKLHSVEARVNPGNSASIKLLERSGFVREAYFKEHYLYEGKFKDTVVYSILTPVK